MKSVSVPLPAPSPMERAASELERAAAARKCWPCGCFQDAVHSIAAAVPAEQRVASLDTMLSASPETFTGREYDCLGCKECYPANAVNALLELGEEVAAGLTGCPSEEPVSRPGWPPLPGDYHVLRYQAPVAVCTLGDRELSRQLAARLPNGLSLVGTLFTENLGIERIVKNLLANPNVRFLILAGEEVEQRIGHWPGQSLQALLAHGVDPRRRILDARGKRPYLKNLTPVEIEAFRTSIEIVDRIGTTDPEGLLSSISECFARDPGPAPARSASVLQPISAQLPRKMVPDPAGYFVVFVDRARGLLTLEHYLNDGVLTAVLEGRGAAELYSTAIERELLTRMDHAAYLGQELARAQRALEEGEDYIQDCAGEAEPSGDSESVGCGCSAPAGGCGS